MRCGINAVCGIRERELVRPVWKSQAGCRINCKLLDKWWEGLAQCGLVSLIRSLYRSARNGMSHACMRVLRACLLAAESSRMPTACASTDGSWLSGAERLCCASWAVWVPQLPMPTSASSCAEFAPVRSPPPRRVAGWWRRTASAAGRGGGRLTRRSSRGAACEWRCRPAWWGAAAARW